MEWSDRPYEWVGDWSGRRASLSPDREAIVDAVSGERYTYGDLEDRANRTARLLARRDVEAGERVALVSRNRIEVFDLFFATGKTGGVLAPLSHRLAPPELEALLELVDPRLLVVESPFVDDVSAALEAAAVEPDVLELPTGDSPEEWDAVGEAIPENDSPLETRRRSLEDPHLLLHTGGSTGTPKETVVTHGSIYWNSLNTITAWGIRPDDVTPLVFPTFHTGGWNVITVPVFHMGGTVVIDREVDPGRVLEGIETHEATVLVAVPAVLRTMARHDEWAGTDLSTLRFVKSGGGPCRAAILDAWRERGVEISQGYGLTECGPNNFAMPDSWERETVSSVGKPVIHADARVVDEDGEVCGPGVVGELELAGPHAAPAYWGTPEESEETFGSGWVSTGDLARVDADGYYHIEGRKKNMFASGGENVYPSEVEDAIADHPAVEEVVVIGVPDEQWGAVGKAVIEGDESISLEGLEDFLDGRLARYKIPDHLEFVETLPTSGPSKLDRAAVEDRFGED